MRSEEVFLRLPLKWVDKALPFVQICEGIFRKHLKFWPFPVLTSERLSCARQFHARPGQASAGRPTKIERRIFMTIHKYGLPVRRRPDGSLYRMTPTQQRQTTRLIKTRCCNCDGGDCLILGCACPQMISRSLLCRWFCNGALPLAPELEAAVFREPRQRKCAVCGGSFLPRSNRQKYCTLCGKIQAQKADAARKRRKRAAMSAFGG